MYSNYFGILLLSRLKQKALRKQIYLSRLEENVQVPINGPLLHYCCVCAGISHNTVMQLSSRIQTVA